MGNTMNIAELFSGLIGIGIIVFFVIRFKRKVARANELNALGDRIAADLTSYPTDEKVFAFMNYIDNNAGGGIHNTPQNWNRVRGLWFIANESPNVTTSTKKQFRDWLLIKGLRLTGNDKNVIDNYGKK